MRCGFLPPFVSGFLLSCVSVFVSTLDVSRETFQAAVKFLGFLEDDVFVIWWSCW